MKIPRQVVQVNALAADGTGNSTTINAGTRGGVKLGDHLIITRVSKVIKDPVTSKTLRTVEAPVGDLQITSVDESSAVGTFSGPARRRWATRSKIRKCGSLQRSVFSNAQQRLGNKTVFPALFAMSVTGEIGFELLGFIPTERHVQSHHVIDADGGALFFGKARIRWKRRDRLALRRGCLGPMEEVASMRKRRSPASSLTPASHHQRHQRILSTPKSNGCSTPQHFINAIYFHCGGLDLAPAAN